MPRSHRKSPVPVRVPDEQDGDQDRLAVLIDADNARPGIVEPLVAEIARFGVASVKRIYGDWTLPQLGGWKKVLLEHSIQPIQQFGYTKGKNSTDSALIIDAMDLMYTGRFDGFCLVSSDSDFTRLASRLREEGLLVYGFGELKTPQPFVKACDKFVYTEVLRSAAESGTAASIRPASPVTPAKANGGAKTNAPPTDPSAGSTAEVAGSSIGSPHELIAQAIDDVSDDSGWAGLGAVGRTVTKLRPDFDSRLYGFGKFSELLRSMPERFELEERPSGAGKALFVRLAPKKTSSGRRQAKRNGG